MNLVLFRAKSINIFEITNIRFCKKGDFEEVAACFKSLESFVSSNKPLFYWPFEYGLGGIFGDTALKKLLILRELLIQGNK